MDYTITLTEAQQKAMEHIAVDVNEWITNAVYNRSNIAINEICQIYTNHKLEKNEPITVIGKDAMVLAAYEEGIIKTATQMNEELPTGLPQ
jgi:hypothetical protein